jgi:hypothetical protein
LTSFVSSSTIGSRTSLTVPQDYQATPEYSLPFAGDLPAESPSDWTFSPPTWQGSPYTVSPLSSAGVSPTTSWNPFERTFASIQTSINNGNFVPSGTSYFASPTTSHQPSYNSNPQGGAYPYVSPAAINGTTTFDEMNEEDNAPTPPINYTAPLPSPTTNFPSSQPVNESARPRRRSSPSSSSASYSSSKTITTTKRQKSLKKEPRLIETRSKSDTTSRLRSKQPTNTTTFASTSSSSSNNSSENKGRKTSRTYHNDVEKQYRNRLNGHFETLLQTLPKDRDGDGERKVSKSEVLVLAKQRIQQLEREKRVLEKEREELEVSVEEMNKRWMELGGVCLP